MQSELNDDLLYDAVRELAYAGRYLDAQGVMDAMADQASDRVLTYRGFTARKLGDLSLANVHYEMAISLNPDNIAARSYMGQGFVEAGDKVAALMQLREIQARGGQGTWAEVSLRQAIETGTIYLVVEQSDLARVPPLTIVSVHLDHGASRLLPLSAEER